MQQQAGSDTSRGRTLRAEKHRHKLPRMERHELQVTTTHDPERHPVDQVIRIDQDSGHRRQYRSFQCRPDMIKDK